MRLLEKAITESVKVQIALLMGLFMSLSLFAQDDVSQFFDDGGISKPNNAFKIDLLATAGGDLTFLYERFLNDKISLEFGVGFALGKGVEPLFIYFENEELLTERGGGLKFLFNPRIHPSGDRRENFVYGLNFFVRSLKDIQYTQATIDRRDIFVGFYQGYMWEMGNRMSIELGYQIGWLFYKEYNEIAFQDNSVPNVGISLKIAYHK